MGGKLQHSDVVWLVVQGVGSNSCTIASGVASAPRLLTPCPASAGSGQQISDIATGIALLGVAALMWLIMHRVWVANCNIATGVALLRVADVVWLVVQGLGSKFQHSHWHCTAGCCCPYVANNAGRGWQIAT